MNSKVTGITKRIDELKVLEKEMKFGEIFHWSDSLITPTWIKSFEKGFGIFAENRLQEIRKLSVIKQWRYIETKHNPVDLITRKRLNMNFVNERFWWEGPSFLKKNEDSVEKINSSEFHFRGAGVLEIKNRSAVNLAKIDFTKQVNLQEVIDI